MPPLPKLTAVLLGVAAAPLALRAAPAQQLDVMSYNVRYATAPDGANAWPNRKAMLIGLVRRAAPDVIGVQEALYLQLGEIRAELPVYGGIGVGRDDGRLAGEFSAILYRRDRFAIVDSGTFWFSDTPEVPGSKSWGNNITRICTWALLRDLPSGRGLYVYNVHLDHESQPSRERSVALLLERIAARRYPAVAVVVTGDFNAGEDNPAVRRMGESFRDSYRAIHPAESVAGTFNGFRGDSTGAKIDYVFTDRLVTRAAAILRDQSGGRFPSDHFPVTARLAFPPE
jgi:endonuclease/exonuclease/phosphatase family metal-dependent hydrolase